MKTTLEIPDDLMREVKIRAASQGRKLKDVVSEAIRNGLAFPRPTEFTSDFSSILKFSAEGFPYIKCGSSEVRPSQDETQRIMDESQLKEDLQRAGITV